MRVTLDNHQIAKAARKHLGEAGDLRTPAVQPKSTEDTQDKTKTIMMHLSLCPVGQAKQGKYTLPKVHWEPHRDAQNNEGAVKIPGVNQIPTWCQEPRCTFITTIESLGTSQNAHLNTGMSAGIA